DTKNFTYDGLGRLTKEQVVREPPGPEDGIHGYVYNTPRTLTYDNLPANAVTEKRAIKWGALDNPPDASQQTSVYKVYDGLNRLRDTFVSTPASLPQEHHIITYNNRGNIVSVSDPDPRVDSTSLVVHTFGYDDRNRLISVTPPAGSLPAGNPLTISYDAWQ